MTSTAPYGFRIVGSCESDRRLIDWGAAFLAYSECDDRAEVYREAYLSAFTFGVDFRTLLDSTGSVKGFAGDCYSEWLWFDIDRDGDLDRATLDARRLAASLVERFRLDGDELLLFFSGSKGYHTGLPLSLCDSPAPSPVFHSICRRLAERFAALAGIDTDTGVYDRVRPFRAPNSRHPKTGLHKRRLSYEELLNLNTSAIRRLAAEPASFDMPKPPASYDLAISDWQQITEMVVQSAAADQERRANGSAKLTRSTMSFIRDGAGTGDRHRLLFSAAANLAEFDCPPALAHALLTDAGLDSGLPPSEVLRQINCGLQHRKP
jgi:hypothetical protein